MGKIVSAFAVTHAGTTFGDVTKVKLADKKAEEVSTTVFGDAAKGRRPHPLIDFDGASFETQDPAAYTGATAYGQFVIVSTNQDATTSTDTFNGWFDASPQEIDVEGERKEGYSCTIHVDGAVVRT
jgi:hypothetical protein